MDKEQFAEWVKKVGPSVTKAAKLLGLSRETVYTYLRGAKIPRLVELACAALQLGVDGYSPDLSPAAAVPTSEPADDAPAALAGPFAGPGWLTPFD